MHESIDPSVIRLADCIPTGAWLPDQDTFVLPTGLTGEQERALMLELLRNANATENTTKLPCPDWCALPAGHQFNTMTMGGQLVRWHEMTDAASVAVDGEQPMVIRVGISAEELAETADAPVAQSGPLRIGVWGLEEGEPLSAEDARQLAAALLNAADRLDEITGSPVTAPRMLMTVADLGIPGVVGITHGSTMVLVVDAATDAASLAPAVNDALRRHLTGRQ